MAEKVKKAVTRQKPGGGGGDGDVGGPEWQGPQIENTNVDVVHGVYAHSMPLAGMMVKKARMQLTNKMNIDPTAQAVVDGNSVPEEFILGAGMCLTFVKPAGEKGFRRNS